MGCGASTEVRPQTTTPTQCTQTDSSDRVADPISWPGPEDDDVAPYHFARHLTQEELDAKKDLEIDELFELRNFGRQPQTKTNSDVKNQETDDLFGLRNTGLNNNSQDSDSLPLEDDSPPYRSQNFPSASNNSPEPSLTEPGPPEQQLRNSSPQMMPDSPQRSMPGTPQQGVPGTRTHQQGVPGTPQQDEPGTPQQGVPGTPQQGVPGTPQQGVPGTPQQDVPGTPQPNVAGTPQQAMPGTPQSNIAGTHQNNIPKLSRNLNVQSSVFKAPQSFGKMNPKTGDLSDNGDDTNSKGPARPDSSAKRRVVTSADSGLGDAEAEAEEVDEESAMNSNTTSASAHGAATSMNAIELKAPTQEVSDTDEATTSASAPRQSTLDASAEHAVSADGSSTHRGTKRKRNTKSARRRSSARVAPEDVKKSKAVYKDFNQDKDHFLAAMERENTMHKRHMSEKLAHREETMANTSRYICHLELLGICRNTMCQDLHTRYAYLWSTVATAPGEHNQCFLKDESYQIEASYCDPNTDETVITLNDRSQADVDFENMAITYKKDNTRKTLHRYTTRSTVQADDTQYITRYPTRWLWYREVDVGVYEPYMDGTYVNTTQDLTQDNDNLPTHDNLERCFMQRQTCPEVTFCENGFNLTLNFDTMTEINHQGQEARICRRPKPPVHVSYPNRWNRLFMPSDGFELVKLSCHDKEYKLAKKALLETEPNKHITSIERIQNPKLMKEFQRRESLMKAQSKTNSIATGLFFHGTSESVLPLILKQGFDFRLSGSRVGAIYGAGSYFARNASYSIGNGYAEGNQVMLVRVLVGQYAEGAEGMRRPPPLLNDNNSDGPLYDTCVDNMYDPTIFVVFQNDQAYPEYLIKYADD